MYIALDASSTNSGIHRFSKEHCLSTTRGLIDTTNQRLKEPMATRDNNSHEFKIKHNPSLPYRSRVPIVACPTLDGYLE